MAILGKNVYLMGALEGDTKIDHTLPIYALGDVTFTVDGAPIARPTSADIAQFFKASHQTITLGFSIEAGEAAIDGIYFLGAGKNWIGDYGLEKGSGKTSHALTGVLATTTPSNPNADISRYEVTINIYTAVAGTQ